MTTGNIWGDAPLELTVDASPTPTATVFTVSDATDLLEGQFINVEVGGDYERTKIESISGDQLTVNSGTYALSGAPDSPGSVISSRQLITNEMLIKGFTGHAADRATVEAYDMEHINQEIKVFVEEFPAGIFIFRPSSALVVDGDRVLSATNKPNGRWEKVLGADSYSEQTTQTTHGFSAGEVVYKTHNLLIESTEFALDEDFSAQLTTMESFKVRNGGSVGYALQGSTTLYQYNLTDGDITTKSYASKSYTVPANTTCFDWSDDGLLLFFGIDTGSVERVDSYSVSVAWQLDSTITLVSTGADLGIGTISEIQWINNGNSILTLDGVSHFLRTHTMATANDTSLMVAQDQLYYSTLTTGGVGCAMASDGSFYLLHSTSESIWAWDARTPFRLNTIDDNRQVEGISATSNILSLPSTNSKSISLSEDDQYLYVANDDETVDQFFYGGQEWDRASARSAPSRCNNPWIITSVIDSNTFIRQKRGKAYIPGHGLKGLSNVIWDTGDVDDIAWQSGTTVRHTWGTNVDLSGVAIGDWVHLKLDNSSGTTTEYYDLQSGYYKITNVSDGSNYIEWSNPYITASTYNISTLVDSTNRIIIYGDAGAGDMQYLSEVDGELSPFPANGGHIELPLAVVIDEDNIEIIGTCGVPKIARPKTILRLVNKETPNDGDDDFELIGRQRISFANPQNWHLKFNFWSFDGTSPLSIDIGNATHRGGEDSLFVDDNADQTLDEDNSFSTGDTAAITLDQLTLTLGGLGVVGNEKGFAEMTYDGQYLFFNAQSFGDDGSTYNQTILKMVDLSAAYFKDCGNTNLDFFDLFVTRV